MKKWRWLWIVIYCSPLTLLRFFSYILIIQLRVIPRQWSNRGKVDVSEMVQIHRVGSSSAQIENAKWFCLCSAALGRSDAERPTVGRLHRLYRALRDRVPWPWFSYDCIFAGSCVLSKFSALMCTPNNDILPFSWTKVKAFHLAEKLTIFAKSDAVLY